MHTSPAPERELLFALVAFQNGFIQREHLLSAFAHWTVDKSRSMQAILCEQGALTIHDRQLIEQLVKRHVDRVASDPESAESVLAQVHTVRDVVLKSVAGDDELARAVHSISNSETVVYQPPQSSLPEVALSTNNFRLLKEHASGGLGRVFIADDLKFGRQVAIKQIRDEHAYKEEYRTKFLLEAEITGQLEHPGIVPVYALGEDERGHPFYAMRLIRGDDLKLAIRQLHRQAPKGKVRLAGPGLRQLLRHFVDACHAVSYAHDRGVLHRDLKPGNIMLGKHGETLVVDWGLAKPLGIKRGEHVSETDTTLRERPLGTSDSASGSQTRYGSFVGTAAYASPEQVLGSLDKLGPTSDVYSLGAILYEILAGQPPLVGKNVEVMIRKVTQGDFTPISDLRPDAPAALIAICRKAMAIEQHDRYPSVTELRQDVQRWLDDLPVAAHREPLRYQAARWLRRHPGWVAALASALIIGATGTGIGSVLLEQKNVDLHAKNLELQASQYEADLRRLDAERALYDSLISEAQLLVRQASQPGWSWEAERKLEQASKIVPPSADVQRLRTLMLASQCATDLQPIQQLADGIDCSELCFSPDGRYLAIGQRKHNLAASIFVFETSQWELTCKLSVSGADVGLSGLTDIASRLLSGERYQEGVLALSFSRDGQWLAAGTRLGRVHMWSWPALTQRGQHTSEAQTPHWVWEMAGGGVSHVEFTADSRTLLASGDRQAQYRAAQWNFQVDSWVAEKQPPVAMASGWLENGQGLVGCQQHGQLTWFDSRTWKVVTSEHLPSTVNGAVSFAPSGELLAYMDGETVVVRDLSTGRDSRLSRFPANALTGQVKLSWNAAADQLVVTADGPQATVIDIASAGAPQTPIAVPGRDKPLAIFNPVKNLLAVSGQYGVTVYQQRPSLGALRRFSVPGCEQVDDLISHETGVWWLGHCSQTVPRHYQVRLYAKDKSLPKGIGSLVLADDAQPTSGTFLRRQPLSLQIPGCAWLQVSEAAEEQFTPMVAAPKSAMLASKEAAARLPQFAPLVSSIRHVCLNGLAPQVSPWVENLGELQVSQSGQVAYAINQDGVNVVCVNLNNFNVLGEWSSRLESNLTGNASPLCVAAAGELAVVGGSDGFIHVLDRHGQVLQRRQLNPSHLQTVAASGQHFAVGAFNGQAVWATIEELDQPLVWQAHAGPVTAIALASDATLVITGSQAGEVTLWQRDGDVMQPLLNLPASSSGVKRLHLEEAGQMLSVVYENSPAAQLWSVDELRQFYAEWKLNW